MRGLTFATNENSYLVGCMAALMTERQGRQAGDQRGGRDQAADRGGLHRGLPRRPSVYETANTPRDGTFEGGTDTVFNLKNNGVALGKTSAKVPHGILDRIDGLRQQIIDGEITPPSTL